MNKIPEYIQMDITRHLTFKFLAELMLNLLTLYDSTNHVCLYIIMSILHLPCPLSSTFLTHNLQLEGLAPFPQ